MDHIMRLWIVDDEQRLAQGLEAAFLEEGYEVLRISRLRELRRALEEEVPEVMLLDVRLPDGSGAEELPRILGIAPEAKIIIMTAYGNSPIVVKAIQEGAYNFLDKPFPLEAVLAMVRTAAEAVELRRQVLHLRSRSMAALIGNSPGIRKIRTLVERMLAHSTDLCLLLQGESGTGKEVVARMVHELSGVSGEFITVNCPAIPEHLLEAELFGYHKGAYTGADRDKVGLVELARRGTLFFDEIGDFPLNLQAKLLRFLDTKTFRPLGGRKEQSVSLNILCATSLDLKGMAQKGTFREDLYYRIGAIPLVLPPLRERDTDVLLLFESFVQHYEGIFGRKLGEITPEVRENFLKYSWRGNVRELKNLVERLFMLKDPQDPVVRLRDLPQEMLEFQNFRKEEVSEGLPLPEEVEEVERRRIEEALTKFEGNRSRAAQYLGISRYALLRKLQRYEK
jgi:DNA-binding NtrC family response regulator